MAEMFKKISDSFKSEPPSPNIKYIVLEMDLGSENWPTKFNFPPKEGDNVQSESGRTLKITEIIHCADNTTIKLGRELGGSTGIEGAGTGPISVEGSDAVT